MAHFSARVFNLDGDIAFQKATCGYIMTFWNFNQLMISADSSTTTVVHIDGLVQERRNSSALAMELHLSCTKPSISDVAFPDVFKARFNMNLSQSLINHRAHHATLFNN